MLDKPCNVANMMTEVSLIELTMWQAKVKVDQHI